MFEAADRIVQVGGRYGEMLKLRNRALIRLSAVTMVRRIEIMRLNIEDYRKPYILVRRPAKESEYTLRILDPETSDILDDYLKLRRRLRVKCRALFVRGRGKDAKRMSLSGLSDLIRKIREVAGIEKPRAGWHAHRRGRITIAHKEGLSEKLLSKYMGLTPEMVKRYKQLDRSDAIQAFARSHPFFNASNLGSGQEFGLTSSERPKRRR
jgi:integrase